MNSKQNASLTQAFARVGKLIGATDLSSSPTFSHNPRNELRLNVSKFSDMEIEDIKSSIVHFSGLEKSVCFTLFNYEDYPQKILSAFLKKEKTRKKVYRVTDESIQQLRSDILDSIGNGSAAPVYDFKKEIDELFANFYEINEKKKGEKKKEKKGGKKEQKEAEMDSAGPKRKQFKAFTIENFSEAISSWEDQLNIIIDMVWQQRINVVDVSVSSVDVGGKEFGDDDYEGFSEIISDYVRMRVLEYPRNRNPNDLMVKFAKEMFDEELLEKLGKRLIFVTGIGNDT
jgi:hypothetical protein